jgi:PhnB protein
MKVEPYLSFEGRCEEAIEFYKKSLAAKVNTLMRFKEAPEGTAEGHTAAEIREKVMHASLTIGESIVMVSDGRCVGKANFHGISLTITVKQPDEAERLFTALSEGGKVSMPMAKTFFSPAFGMVNDKFGVSWLVIVQ